MADLSDVPEAVRREFVRRLLAEVREMSDDELAMLLMHGLDDPEMRCRVREIEIGETLMTIH